MTIIEKISRLKQNATSSAVQGGAHHHNHKGRPRQNVAGAGNELSSELWAITAEKAKTITLVQSSAKLGHLGDGLTWTLQHLALAEVSAKRRRQEVLSQSLEAQLRQLDSRWGPRPPEPEKPRKRFFVPVTQALFGSSGTARH